MFNFNALILTIKEEMFNTPDDSTLLYSDTDTAVYLFLMHRLPLDIMQTLRLIVQQKEDTIVTTLINIDEENTLTYTHTYDCNKKTLTKHLLHHLCQDMTRFAIQE